jgi:hypothetical protein
VNLYKEQALLEKAKWGELEKRITEYRKIPEKLGGYSISFYAPTNKRNQKLAVSALTFWEATLKKRGAQVKLVRVN